MWVLAAALLVEVVAFAIREAREGGFEAVHTASSTTDIGTSTDASGVQLPNTYPNPSLPDSDDSSGDND